MLYDIISEAAKYIPAWLTRKTRGVEIKKMSHVIYFNLILDCGVAVHFHNKSSDWGLYEWIEWKLKLQRAHALYNKRIIKGKKIEANITMIWAK